MQLLLETLSIESTTTSTHLSYDPPPYTFLCIVGHIFHLHHLNQPYQCTFAGIAAAVSFLLFVFL